MSSVSEVVQTLQLRDQTDAVGDLSVCLDGMTVDPEMFATAEADQHRKLVPSVLLSRRQRCRERALVVFPYFVDRLQFENEGNF